MRKVDAEYGDDWWFKVWGPDKLAEEGIGTRDDWMLRRRTTTWHGFGNARRRLQHARPDQGDHRHAGPRRGRRVRRDRHPGRDRHQVPGRARHHRREDAGCTRSSSCSRSASRRAAGTRWSPRCSSSRTTTTSNQPLWRILPEFVRAAPALRAHGPARPVPADPRASTSANDIARLTTEMYLSDMQPAMKPSRRVRQASRTARSSGCAIDELEGRITTSC